MKHTLKQLKTIRYNKLLELINIAGGPTHLGKMLYMDYSVIRGWIKRECISKKGAYRVEKHFELGKHFKAIELRPDL